MDLSPSQPLNDPMRLRTRLQTLSKWLSSSIALTALLTLVGWQFDLALFKRPIPGLVAMHPLTALCFMAASASLLLYTNDKGNRWGLVLTSLPLLVGLLILIRHLTGWGPHLQGWFFTQKLQADAVGNLSNRMAPNTAFCFILSGFSLACLRAPKHPKPDLAQALAIVVATITLVPLLGYTYRVQAFYGALASYPIAIHTALCFLALALAMLLATPHQGFVREVFVRWANGLPGQSLLGLALLGPFGLGLLVLSGYWAGWFSTELAIAVFVASFTLLFAVLLWHNVKLLNHRDQQQQILFSLRQQEEQIQTLFRAAPDAILVTNDQEQIVTWNQQAVQLLKVANEDMLRNRPMESLISPSFRADFRRAHQVVVPADDQRLPHNLDLTMQLDNQAQFEAALSISQTVIQGKPLFISLIRDVTQQRMAAQHLYQANADLQRSNENLQQFAYVASHDLQEPLRKIQQFVDLLKTHYVHAGGEALFYLERIQSAAGRMSSLIRDLLDFSRIATQRDPNSLVSLAAIISQVVTTLELTIQETGAQVLVEALPAVVGDASQLQQLFQNLLSNALKFRHPGVKPLVVVQASRVAADQLPAGLKPGQRALTYHRIDVTDNGVGFDTKYLDRIFQVFQRLHSKSEFAGTGIGLAICEKVVINHGGLITASSQPGQGATFSVYLPV